LNSLSRGTEASIESCLCSSVILATVLDEFRGRLELVREHGSSVVGENLDATKGKLG
jgi:hypothetical protein